MLGIRLIRTAQAALREINYTGGLPLVTCGWLFALGLYAYVVGKLAYPGSVVKCMLLLHVSECAWIT